jgi:ankyrin repeat protein
MPTVPLPENPDLAQLRKRARDLQKAVRAGQRRALALVAEHNPQADVRGFALNQAQLALARHYGFTSWPRLRRHLEIIAARSWTFAEQPADIADPAEPPAPPSATQAPASSADRAAARFLRLACLNFAEDAPPRRERAAALLAAEPDLPSTGLAVAAACADVDAVRRHLAADPAAATRPAEPYGWSPLMYQAYARHDPAIGREDTLATARLLLDAGADPDDGRFFIGLPTPFTLLTGLFGGDPSAQPEHRWAVPFADLLLSSGADPNDGQTLYNRMFGLADDHLEILFAHGLGRGDGGAWRRLLGDQVESPAAMLASLLDWAVAHDQRDRVALLAANGVDVAGPLVARRRYSDTGRTPIKVALMNGNVDLAGQLRGYGVPEPELDPVDAFVGAALAGDAAAVAATPPKVIAAARRARPGVLVWAAGLGRAASIELLAGAGFDLNALGRADVPVEEPWETALHAAAGNGDLALVRMLVELGADPTIRDKRFKSTPLAWALHLHHRDVATLLSTTPSPAI